MGKRPAPDDRAVAFEARLVETGGSIDEPFDGYAGYGHDAEFRYRWWPDRIQVGLRESFDRWANSVDWVLYRPIERTNLDVLRAACHVAAQAIPEPDDQWTEIDIGGYYRQARRWFKQA